MVVDQGCGVGHEQAAGRPCADEPTDLGASAKQTSKDIAQPVRGSTAMQQSARQTQQGLAGHDV